MGIEACEAILPGVPMVAVFDTAFHQTMPKKSYLYGLPHELYTKYGVRRYGFHGTSHKYVSQRAAEMLGNAHIYCQDHIRRLLFRFPAVASSFRLLSVVCLILLQSEQSVIQIFSAVIFLQKMIQCIIILQRHTDHHIIDNLVFTVWIIIHDITLL